MRMPVNHLDSFSQAYSTQCEALQGMHFPVASCTPLGIHRSGTGVWLVKPQYVHQSGLPRTHVLQYGSVLQVGVDVTCTHGLID